MPERRRGQGGPGVPVRLLQAVGREPARGPAPGGGHHAPLHRRPLLPRRGGPPAARRSRADPRARAPVSVRSRDGQPPPRATGEALVTVESTRNEGLASSTTGFPPLRWVFCGTRRPPPRQRRLPLGPGSRPRAPSFHGGWYLSTHCSHRCVARSPLPRGTDGCGSPQGHFPWGERRKEPLSSRIDVVVSV